MRSDTLTSTTSHPLEIPLLARDVDADADDDMGEEKIVHDMGEEKIVHDKGEEKIIHDMGQEKIIHDEEREPNVPVSNYGVVYAPEKVLKHSHDADEAMKAFVGYEGELLVLDEATNKRLLRKIDLNVMPVMCLRLEIERACLIVWVATLCGLWPQFPG